VIRIAILFVALTTISAWMLANSAGAVEVTPTPQMTANAQQMIKLEWPDDNPSSYEYHFRNLSGHILWCAHSSGGNGGFCRKITSTMVAENDRAAKDYCKTTPDDDTLPHSIYGELYDLGYKCVRGRMSRLPVAMALDSEGYVRTQWKLLPITPQ
jgi:hypothetical protein